MPQPTLHPFSDHHLTEAWESHMTGPDFGPLIWASRPVEVRNTVARLSMGGRLAESTEFGPTLDDTNCVRLGKETDVAVRRGQDRLVPHAAPLATLKEPVGV